MPTKKSGPKQSDVVNHQQIDMIKISAMAGALAGAVARFVVGPLDVIKIRFQVQLEPIVAGARISHYTSLRQAFTTIIKEEGIQVRTTTTTATVRHFFTPPLATILHYRDYGAAQFQDNFSPFHTPPSNSCRSNNAKKSPSNVDCRATLPLPSSMELWLGQLEPLRAIHLIY